MGTTQSNRSLGAVGLAALSLALALIAVLGLQLILPFHDLAGTRGPKSLYVLWAWPIGAAAAAIFTGSRSRRKLPSTRYSTRIARLGILGGGLVLVLIMMTIGTMVAVSENTPQQITVDETKPLVRP